MARKNRQNVAESKEQHFHISADNGTDYSKFLIPDYASKFRKEGDPNLTRSSVAMKDLLVPDYAGKLKRDNADIKDFYNKKVNGIYNEVPTAYAPEQPAPINTQQPTEEQQVEPASQQPASQQPTEDNNESANTATPDMVLNSNRTDNRVSNANIHETGNSNVKENSIARSGVNWNDPTAQAILSGLNEQSNRANFIDNEGKFDEDTWMSQTGIDRNAIRAERERQQELARKRGIESAILQSFLIGSDLFGNAIGTFAAPGKYVTKREKDNTGKEAREEIDKLREMQNAEDAAHGQLVMESKKNAANQAIQNMKDIAKMFSTNQNESNRDVNSSSDRTNDDTTTQTSTTNETQIGDRYGNKNDDIRFINELVKAGTITKEEGNQFLKNKYKNSTGVSVSGNGSSKTVDAPYLAK